MAHMIDFSNNRANLAYTGETPWHGLGQKMDSNQTIDQWRIAAGLSWEAIRCQEFYKYNGKFVESADQILARSDNGYKLGNITKRYQPVQPGEVLEFFRDIVALQDWSMDVIGSLDNGKRIWALARTDREFNVRGTVDRVGAYLLLATSFDGTMATIGKFSSVRVVCQNTLSMSLGDSLAKIKVGHNTEFNAEKMKTQLGIIDNSFEQLQEEANMLASRKVSGSEAMQFIVNLLAGEDKKVEELSTRQANIIKLVYDKFDGKGKGATLPSANGTAWGLVNAVTEYVDHDYGRNNNNRLRNAWFGQGDDLKTKAKNKALALVA